jgi:hypothetical protein
MQLTTFKNIFLSIAKQKELWWSAILSVLLGISITTLNFINEIVEKTNISSIIWLFIIVCVNIGAITALGYISGVGKGERFLLVSTLSTLILYIFLYYLRLSENQLALGSSLAINTRQLGSIAIVGIYGITVFYLLRHEVLPFFIRAGIAFLVILSTYSFFSFVSINSRTNTPFTQDVLNLLIRQFNPLPWLFLTSITLAFISRADLNFRQLKQEIGILINLVGYYFMIVLGVYFISISGFGVNAVFYWQQAFIAFILWDFVYRYTRLMHDENNKSITFKTAWKDVLYYMVLLVLVVSSSLFISFLPTK